MTDGIHICFVLLDLQGGPYWNVPTGRRDGVISRAPDVLLSLPAPFHNLTTLITVFGNVGLDVKDLVLLSGMSNSNKQFPYLKKLNY